MFFGTRMALAACLVCICGLATTGCDANNEQDEFAEQASQPPSDITVVTEEGEVVEEDEDDWRTSPAYLGEIRIRPAQPNPARVSDFVSIDLTVTVFDAVRGPLRLEARYQGQGRLQTLDVVEQASDPGAYLFTFPASAIGATGLHRLFVFDGVGEIVSYGDVLIQ